MPKLISEASPAPNVPSLAPVIGSSVGLSKDASTLLTLLSFLITSEKIPLDFLFRGATPRKRWGVGGEIKEDDAKRVGLVQDVVTLLSDVQNLSNTLHELDRSFAVLNNTDQSYTLDAAVAARVRGSLPSEELRFWRYQALVVAYRAIPWKYIETT